MPFNYMTFVIKDQIEKNGVNKEDYLFDLEPYNYIFNKSSSFLDDRNITNNANLLEYVLSHMANRHVDYLEILYYSHSLVAVHKAFNVVNSPLRMALKGI